MENITITENQKKIIARLGDPIYTPEHLETWLNSNDNVFANAPAALTAMGAHGFYKAVLAIEKLERSERERLCKEAEENADGTCRGYCHSETDDEPAEMCKECERSEFHGEELEG